MAKLYYGNGKCTVEGNVRGVHIKYRGAIEIDDKTSDSFAIVQQNNGIIIFPIGKGTLNDLFDYVGEFKILSVQSANEQGEKEPTTIHKVMDYTELLNTKSEDMTTKSEDLSATYISGGIVSKTLLKQPYINNLNTSIHNVELYLQDGTKYDGSSFHIHLADNSAMTGSEHTEDSQDLYYMSRGKLVPTKNPSLIPPATKERDMMNIAKNKKQGNKY
ncbi:hypothetical protein CMI37_36875 [Candidatus Pacearchaeota archaeon]|nr:hypothetical protein [Candidatus Pacearchaeota archaeon]|tara:strand:+ start:1414 stop:2064 length:651 start_codon:yes stop_codon:yes gene_type:complete